MNDVSTLLRRATDDLAPTRDLVAGAVRTGRRRRRRHLALAAAAVVSIGVSAAGVVPSSESERTPVTTEAPSAGPVAPRDFAVPAEDMSRVLAAMVGGRPQDAGPGFVNFRSGAVRLAGALVTLSVERTSLPRCGEQPPGVACDAVGDGFEAARTYDEPGAPSGVVATNVTLYTGDGFAIAATAYNAPAEKGAAPLTDRPVLGAVALRDLVHDPLWLD